MTRNGDIDDDYGDEQQPAPRSENPERQKLRDITERIQVGDAEEGAAALEELMAHSERRGRAALQNEITERELQRQNQAALDKFAKKYPRVASNDLLAEAGVTAMRREIEKDLKDLGIKDEVLAPVRGNAQMLVRAHNEARARGAKVRSPEEILEATGGVLSEQFGIRSAQRSAAEVVRDMRVERGYSRSSTDDSRGSRAPGSGSLTEDQQERTRRYVAQRRAQNEARARGASR
jgi:hypothetical protein